jgi:hypothetical protein
LQNYKKSGETPKFHPIYFFSFTLATLKNGKIEIWKNGKRYHGALKAQLLCYAHGPGTLTVQTRAEPSLLGLCRV